MQCVLYLRMSREFQENSTNDQRNALTAHAKKHRYKIVDEYCDEGISGDATEKRLAFLKMIDDCKSGRFKLVLCWDQDRFGRFDPLEAGYWIKPMRDAGVMLETLAQGRVDWNDFAGRVIWSVTQEGKHSYLRDLARNSLRGNIARAKAGKHSGPVPFGLAVDGNGRLGPGDPVAVAAVRAIFEYRKLRLGYRTIAARMTADGFRSHSGLNWTADGVRAILNREAYAGTLVYGKLHLGKYSTSVDGAVGPPGSGRRNLAPIRVENAHEAIIDAETWQAVRSIDRESIRPHANKNGPGAPLAGLLICGRCGSPMYSQSFRRPNGNQFPAYTCSAYMTGRGCGCCTVRHQFIHGIVATTIHQKYLMGSIKALTAEIAKQMRAIESKHNAAAAERRIRDLDAKIDKATKRLLVVDERLFRPLEAQVLEMKSQREQLAATVADKGNSASAREIAEAMWIDPAAFNNESRAEEIRATLKQFIDSIRLDFVAGRKTGRGQRFDFSGGEVVSKQFKNSPLII